QLSADCLRTADPYASMTDREPIDLLRHMPTRALWTTPLAGEAPFPAQRIIHCRALQLGAPARLKRLGLRAPTSGYCKAVDATDWITALRVLAWDGERWRVPLDRRRLPQPTKDRCRWFDLDGLTTSALIIEARACAVD